jgi:ferritin-like metal-binding protein YciE
VAELNTRDTKLVQYLNEAFTKEKQLEQALESHIGMTTLAPYKKRLQQHLSETKRHAREVERRIKKIGGEPQGITGVVQDAAHTVQGVAARGAALAQGPIHMVRGTSEQEVLLKNARTEFKEEAEEIAHYTALQNLAEKAGDRETASLAKAILREEKRMAGFLEKLIPRLAKSVAQSDIPARERNGGTRRRTSTKRASTSSRSKRTTSARSKRTTSARSGSSRSKKATRSRTTSGRSRSTTARSGSSKSARPRTTSARSRGSKSTGSRSTSARSGARRSTSRSK